MSPRTPQHLSRVTKKPRREGLAMQYKNRSRNALRLTARGQLLITALLCTTFGSMSTYVLMHVVH